MDESRGKRSTTRSNEAERVRLRRLLTGARKQQLMHRRHPGIPGYFVFRHRAPERKRIEFSGNNYGAAGEQSGHGGANQSMNVKQRHDAKRDIVLRKRVGVRNIR